MYFSERYVILKNLHISLLYLSTSQLQRSNIYNFVISRYWKESKLHFRYWNLNFRFHSYFYFFFLELLYYIMSFVKVFNIIRGISSYCCGSILSDNRYNVHALSNVIRERAIVRLTSYHQ